MNHEFRYRIRESKDSCELALDSSSPTVQVNDNELVQLVYL